MDTVVMAVHNDEKYLPYSLAALKTFKAQIIFVFDSPSICGLLAQKFML